MAQIVVTKINDGPKNAVFHVAITGLGLGELEDSVLIDPATSFDPAYEPKPGMTIDELWFDLTGFDAKLEFDYLVSDTPVWSISGGSAGYLDFRTFGGLKDRSNPGSGLGKLKLTTTGLGAGDNGSLIVKVKKG